MKLPNLEDASVKAEKITDYLLSAAHPNGRHKAKFFTSFGFSVDSWQQLAGALIQHARENEVARTEPSPFGIRYVINGTIISPDCRNPTIRSVWFIEAGQTVPCFVTAAPPGREGAMIKELDNIVLTVDLPQFGLASGDIGTVVMVHTESKGYEVEFITLDGETIAVTSLGACRT